MDYKVIDTDTTAHALRGTFPSVLFHAKLRYHSGANPYAVYLEVPPHASRTGEGVLVELSRDLLQDGLVRTVGDGNLQVGVRGFVYEIGGEYLKTTGTIQVQRQVMTVFLEKIFLAVPKGSEGDHIPVAEIEAFLA